MVGVLDVIVALERDTELGDPFRLDLDRFERRFGDQVGDLMGDVSARPPRTLLM